MLILVKAAGVKGQNIARRGCSKPTIASWVSKLYPLAGYVIFGV